MPNKLSNKEFIDKASLVHAGRYNYTNTIYQGSVNKVSVICGVHGEFFTRAAEHLKGRDCQACVNGLAGMQKRRGGASILEQLLACSPGSKYFYPDLVDTTKTTDKMQVTCLVHGNFKTRPSDIFDGSGCPQCASEQQMTPVHSLLEKFSLVHGDLYSYPDIAIGNGRTKINIRCSSHGLFTQTRQQHLKGSGCPSCWAERRKEVGKIPFSQFLRRAVAVHGDKYMYDSSTYSMVKSKINIVCKLHGVFDQKAYDHIDGVGCPSCAATGPSKGQLELAEFLSGLGFDIKVNYRYGTDHKREVDVFVPSKLFGIEFHGIYFHSSKFVPSNYHLTKHNELRSCGLDVLQVFSDEWSFRSEQVKQIIRARLGLTKSIGARQCKLVSVDSPTAVKFYKDYHIQGSPVGGQHLGLSFGGRLVSVMSMSKKGSSRRGSSECGSWELSRYASANVRVSGGASRLLKAHLVSTKATKIVSFSDNRYFSGGMYRALGFVNEKVIQPSYSYIKDGGVKRLHKSKFQKHLLPALLGRELLEKETEKEACASAGYYQVHDCGLVRWVLTLSK